MYLENISPFGLSEIIISCLLVSYRLILSVRGIDRTLRAFVTDRYDPLSFAAHNALN